MTAPAACPVCGGSCKSFPDIEYSADYPFLPGGTVAKSNEDTVTATGRLFDADGVLRYRAGQQVPKSELKDLTERPSASATAQTEPAEADTPQTAAKKSAKRKPARETR